jgi:hypothetical protein
MPPGKTQVVGVEGRSPRYLVNTFRFRVIVNWKDGWNAEFALPATPANSMRLKVFSVKMEKISYGLGSPVRTGQVGGNIRMLTMTSL